MIVPELCPDDGLQLQLLLWLCAHVTVVVLSVPPVLPVGAGGGGGGGGGGGEDDTQSFVSVPVKQVLGSSQ